MYLTSHFSVNPFCAMQMYGRPGTACIIIPRAECVTVHTLGVPRPGSRRARRVSAKAGILSSWTARSCSTRSVLIPTSERREDVIGHGGGSGELRLHGFGKMVGSGLKRVKVRTMQQKSGIVQSVMIPGHVLIQECDMHVTRDGIYLYRGCRVMALFQ